MAKKKAKSKVAHHHPLHKHLHRKVHDVVGYGVLLVFSVLTLFIVLSVSGK